MNNNESKTRVRLQEMNDLIRLHIGSFFTDLNESDYQDLQKIFSKTSGVRDIEKLKGEFDKFDFSKNFYVTDLEKIWNFFLPHLQSKGEVSDEEKYKQALYDIDTLLNRRDDYKITPLEMLFKIGEIINKLKS